MISQAMIEYRPVSAAATTRQKTSEEDEPYQATDCGLQAAGLVGPREQPSRRELRSRESMPASPQSHHTPTPMVAAVIGHAHA